VSRDRASVTWSSALPKNAFHAGSPGSDTHRTALDETIEYVRHRSAFGQSIGAFQATRFRLAECHTMFDVATAWIDRCRAAHVQGELTPVDAAKAKLAATEVQNKVIDHCLQLHGGYGYMQEYRIARAWQDARVTRIFGGTSEVMREIIGRSLSLSAQPSRKGVREAAIGAADLETAVPWRHPDLNPACITVAGRSDEDWARALVPRTKLSNAD
jgi:hypothetical protein